MSFIFSSPTATPTRNSSITVSFSLVLFRKTNPLCLSLPSPTTQSILHPSILPFPLSIVALHRGYDFSYLDLSACLPWGILPSPVPWGHGRAVNHSVRDIMMYNKKYTVDLYLCCWHRVPTTLEISWMKKAVKVSFFMLMRWLLELT